MRIKPAELGIGFGSQDEEAAGLVQGVEAGEVQVGPVHDVEGAGLGQEQVHDLDVVELAIGDVDESRNTAAQVQQGMQLDRRLGLAEVGPREQRQAEIDGGRIQSVDGVVQLQTEVFVPVEAAGRVDETLGEVGVDAPVPNLIGVGQGVARDATTDDHVIELGGLCAQAGLDIAQAFPVGDLGEGHAAILIRTSEPLDLAVAAVALHATPKGVPWQMIHDLREDQPSRIHAPPPTAVQPGQESGDIRSPHSSR